MNAGESFTRASVWLAIAGYAAGAAFQLRATGHPNKLREARLAWTLGCGFFLVHVACAFAFFHAWSHAAAERETAQQTAALTGWRWGGGIWFNYVFAVAWLADVLWWWMAPRSFARRSRVIEVLWQSFFFFMVFNGAVVFAHGPVRWLGLAVCGGLAALWWRTARRVNADR